MRKFALFASLIVSSLCFADTNAERPNLDDPEVRKKIIEEAVVLEFVKKADGSLQYFEPLDFEPYQGSGWGVIYYDNNDQDEPSIIYISEDKAGSNRKQRALFQFLKGEREGLAITWHENGQKQSEGSYKNGKSDGLATYWYEHGQKEQEANWKDGKQDGLTTHWYENGQKKEEVNWKDGKQDGLGTHWHEDGWKKIEQNFKDGKDHGVGIIYDKNGNQTSIQHWNLGTLVSEKKP